MIRWMRRIAWIVAVVAVVAAGVFVLRSKKAALESLPPPAVPPHPVATATVRAGSVADEVRTVALVQSDTSAQVAAQVGGVLQEVRVREGDSVKKGQVLARIDPRTLADAVETARARVSAADEDFRRQEAVFARDQALFDGRAISRQALDLSRAQLEGARAARVSARQGQDSARTVRSYADVVSPFDGRVTARLAEPGDLAAPGKALFSIQVPGTVRLVSKLSQDVVARLKAGDEVVFADAGRTAKGTVTRIYPALDPAHLGVVETVLDAAPFGLPAGATVAATYVPASVAGLLVPASAILRGLDQTLVIRVRDGRAEPVPVEVAGRSARDVAVQGGIAAGDVVVTGLPSELMSLAASRPAVVAQAPAQR